MGNIKEAITYLERYHEIKTEKTESGYRIINPQGVAMKVTEQAIINYANNLKRPPKIVSIIPNLWVLEGK